MEFHPFANTYRLMSDAELEVLEAEMKSRGYDERFPIVLFEKKILDGRNRFRSAERAGVNPTFLVFEGSEADAKAFVKRANCHRRHLTFAEQKQHREEVIEVVAELRREGNSLRQIADKVGVAEVTVRRNLSAAPSGAAEAQPPDGVVVGKDGKRQPAKRKPKPKAEKPPEEPGDAYEGPVAGADATATGFDAIAPHIAEFRAIVNEIDAMKRTLSALAAEPWGRWLAVQGIHIDLDNARRAIKFAAPEGVCPYCKGTTKYKGTPCPGCKSTGWVSKGVYESAPKELRS